MKLLQGWQLSAFRAAKRLRVLDAYCWYRRTIQGDIVTLIPLADPLDGSHLFVALGEHLEHLDGDHFEISPADLDSWLNDAIRSHPDYDAKECSRTIYKCLQEGRAEFGNPWSLFHAENGKIVIDVCYRRGQGPAMTRGQAYHFSKCLRREPRIDQAVIARCREEAVSRDWASPFPDVRDGQPIEIVIHQVSLAERIARWLRGIL